jgi:hypothetical protein
MLSRLTANDAMSSLLTAVRDRAGCLTESSHPDAGGARSMGREVVTTTVTILFDAGETRADLTCPAGKVVMSAGYNPLTGPGGPPGRTYRGVRTRRRRARGIASAITTSRNGLTSSRES